MKKIGAAFENFAFRAFDFNGRATLLEYWLLMPLIWGLIIFLTYGDVVEFWDFLLRKQVPPLNPLYWDGILVFFVTFVPRLSLTVRRLHDSGKSGKWAKLPFVALSSGFVMCFGMLTAVGTSDLGGFDTALSSENSEAVSQGFLALIMMAGFGNLETVWEVLFATAAIMNAIGWDAIWGTLAELTAAAPKPDLARGLSNISNEMVEAPAETGSMLLLMVIFIGTPFIAAFLHLFFMIMPSTPDFDDKNKMSGSSLRKQGVSSDNPFAGYKHLYEKSPEEKARAKASAKEEIRSLYQQRVLGANG